MTRGGDATFVVSDKATRGIAHLVSRLADLGGVLSRENAGQPWGHLIALIQQTRKRLQDIADSLQICFDACNLVKEGG